MFGFRKLLPQTAYYPSILKQTGWKCGFYEFPGQHSGVEYFNCGIVDWQQRRWLVTRRRRIPMGRVGQNDIMFWLLRDNKPVKGHPVRIKEVYPGEHQEDPRVIVRNGNLIMSYCNFRWCSKAHQCLAGLDNSLCCAQPLHIVYGKNGQNLMANDGHEKNWTWFVHDGVLHFVYTIEPHTVCATKMGKVIEEFTCDQQLNWTYGEPRGGTPPVRVGNLYYAFFHSRLPHPIYRARYFMGAYAFKAEPPFEIVSVTTTPLLGGSDEDQRNKGAVICVFPCGAIFENDSWLVTGGSNDHTSFWIRVPHKDLLKKLKPICQPITH